MNTANEKFTKEEIEKLKAIPAINQAYNAFVVNKSGLEMRLWDFKRFCNEVLPTIPFLFKEKNQYYKKQ